MKIKNFCAGFTITLLVSAMILYTLNITNVQAQDMGSFNDVPDSYDYSQAVNYLHGTGVVEGYSDGTFRPDNTINRAEFLKIIILSKGETPEGTGCFPDVNGQWYDGYVCKAKESGLVEGYPDGNFKPERPINFVESGKIVSIGLHLIPDESFQDDWYHSYVKAIEERKGIPPSIVTFDQYINRGEMAEMIWRIMMGQDLPTAYYGDLKQATSDKLVHEISSCDELKEKFESAGSRYYGYEGMTMETQTSKSFDDSADESTLVPTAGTNLEGGAEEYSTTNVQVEGVDEADIVKTDGEYIYIVKGDSIRVLKAYPPSQMVELDAVGFDDESFLPEDMYVDGNKLVVVGASYVEYQYPSGDNLETAIYPYYGGNTSKVYIMDISDKQNIKKFRELEFEGNYNQSRKVDEMVYLVLNRFTFWAYPQIESADAIIPRYKDSEHDQAVPICDCSDVKYVPDFDQSNYLILVGIPIDEADADISKEVVLGSSDNVYASVNNMYVASSNWDTALNSSQTTNVYKFNLGEDNVDFLKKGNVPGRVLNQFSMDEYDNHFRIATTKSNMWNGMLSNSVYVLDENMDMAGKLENIAPDERIYSTRFIGDRLYMVTFKQIDPFFVIDMADHKFPKILGELKIPGYSDYLHPYDENHILGFGKETVDPTELEEQNFGLFDFEWFQGMKVALFDVTDVKNPIQKFKVVIGDRGTESALLYDHKALLFDKARNLLAFPVKVAILNENVKDPGSPQNIYGEYVFQGAYVYKIDTENGFDLQAQITHYDTDELGSNNDYYWFGEKNVQRILYLDDYLYTVSKGMVKVNDMTSDYEETDSLRVGGESNMYFITR